MKNWASSEQGSAFLIVTVLIVVVGIFSLNIGRVSVQTLSMQSKDRILEDRNQVVRYIRTVLSNPDLCKKLVKVDRNNQVQINGFEFQSGRVLAERFQLEGLRYILGDLQLADFTFTTRCPNMEEEKRACNMAGIIPLLIQLDPDGNVLRCEYGSGPNHCQSIGGVWQKSSKTCDLCLGLGGQWRDGRCAFL